jgi:hypothetical protein
MLYCNSTAPEYALQLIGGLAATDAGLMTLSILHNRHRTRNPLPADHNPFINMADRRLLRTPFSSHVHTDQHNIQVCLQASSGSARLSGRLASDIVTLT